jgi:hypothetical protein
MVTQSSVVDGGISVDIVSNGSLHQLPPMIEVAPNRIVRFSARGGNGQPGGIGGDGENGKPGADGAAATRTIDATVSSHLFVFFLSGLLVRSVTNILEGWVSGW